MKNRLPLEYSTEPLTDADRDLQNALHRRLVELVSEPLTPRSLTAIGQFVERAKALMVVGRAPTMPASNGFGASVGVSADFIGAPGYDMTLPLSSAPPAETFGATVIREAVAAIAKMTEKKESPVELITAIAAARDKGLDDLAKRLEERLLDVPTLQKATTTLAAKYLYDDDGSVKDASNGAGAAAAAEPL